MDKRYAKQIIEWAEEAKQTLTIRKEIIIDESVTDEKLGNIIRMMYKAKVETQNEQIKHAKQKAEL
jgi:lysine/ornithine N-monooxygenase